MKPVYDKKDQKSLATAGVAEKHPDLVGKWLARYEAPGLGIRYIRNGCGRPVVYDLELHAEREAKDALIKALNNRPAMVQQRVVVVPRKPRNGGKPAGAFWKR